MRLFASVAVIISSLACAGCCFSPVDGGAEASTGSRSSAASSGMGTGTGTSSYGSTTGAVVGTTGSSSGTSGTGSTSGGTATSSAATGATSGGTTGGSTGGMWDAGFCALTEFHGCTTEADCHCNQWCVYDHVSPLGGSDQVCETPCNTDGDCPNAASACTGLAIPSTHGLHGNTCTANVCATCTQTGCTRASEPGSTCDIGAAGAGGGTCMPINAFGFGICMPNGSATTCTLDQTNDNPFEITVISPQPKDAALFCGAGAACYNAGGIVRAPGTCAQLCALPTTDGGLGCPPSTSCLMQEPGLPYWGFCLPCQSSGSDGGQQGLCYVNSDCCEANCLGSSVNAGGRCFPASG